jgi:hypothetical protein
MNLTPTHIRNILISSALYLRKDSLQINALQGSFKNSEFEFATNSYREVAHKIVFELAKEIGEFDLVMHNVDFFKDFLITGKKYTEIFSNSEQNKDGFRIKFSKSQTDFENIRVVLNPIDGFENFLHGMENMACSLVIQYFNSNKWEALISAILIPFNETFICLEQSGRVTFNLENVRYREVPRQNKFIAGNVEGCNINLNNFSYTTYLLLNKSIDGFSFKDLSNIHEILPALEILQKTSYNIKIKKRQGKLDVYTV